MTNTTLSIDIETRELDVEIRERGTDRVIANLFADQPHYVVDQPAEDYAAAIMDRPARDLTSMLLATLSPAECRLIAFAPTLD
jgi:hypothetical protein